MVCGRLVISFKQASSEARLGTLRPATALLLCGSWPTRAGLARELAQTPKPLSHLDFSRCAAVYGVLDIGPFLFQIACNTAQTLAAPGFIVHVSGCGARMHRPAQAVSPSVSPSALMSRSISSGVAMKGGASWMVSPP